MGSPDDSGHTGRSLSEIRGPRRVCFSRDGVKWVRLPRPRDAFREGNRKKATAYFAGSFVWGGTGKAEARRAAESGSPAHGRYALGLMGRREDPERVPESGGETRQGAEKYEREETVDDQPILHAERRVHSL